MYKLPNQLSTSSVIVNGEREHGTEMFHHPLFGIMTGCDNPGKVNLITTLQANLPASRRSGEPALDAPPSSGVVRATNRFPVPQGHLEIVPAMDQVGMVG